MKSCITSMKLSIPWPTWSTCLGPFPFLGSDQFYLQIKRVRKQLDCLVGLQVLELRKAKHCFAHVAACEAKPSKDLAAAAAGSCQTREVWWKPTLWKYNRARRTSADDRSLNWVYGSPNLTQRRPTKSAYHMHDWYGLERPHVVLNRPSILFILAVTIHVFCCKCPRYKSTGRIYPCEVKRIVIILYLPRGDSYLWSNLV